MLVMPLATHSSGLWPYSITESETVCLVALATHPGTLPTFQLLWTWMEGWFTSSWEGELLWWDRPARLTQRIWLVAGHYTVKRTGNRPIAYVYEGQWISPSWRLTMEHGNITYSFVFCKKDVNREAFCLHLHHEHLRFWAKKIKTPWSNFLYKAFSVVTTGQEKSCKCR